MIKIAILGRKKDTGNYAGYSSTMSAAPPVTLNPGEFPKNYFVGSSSLVSFVLPDFRLTLFSPF